MPTAPESARSGIIYRQGGVDPLSACFEEGAVAPSLVQTLRRSSSLLLGATLGLLRGIPVRMFFEFPFAVL
jgi:hypothetical protein